MTTKRIRKKRKKQENLPQPQPQPISSYAGKNEKPPIEKKKRKKVPLIAYLVVALIFFGSISFFIYVFFLEDIIQEANWLLTDVVTAFVLFLLLL